MSTAADIRNESGTPRHGAPSSLRAGKVAAATLAAVLAILGVSSLSRSKAYERRFDGDAAAVAESLRMSTVPKLVSVMNAAKKTADDDGGISVGAATKFFSETGVSSEWAMTLMAKNGLDASYLELHVPPMYMDADSSWVESEILSAGKPSTPKELANLVSSFLAKRLSFDALDRFSDLKKGGSPVEPWEKLSVSKSHIDALGKSLESGLPVPVDEAALADLRSFFSKGSPSPEEFTRYCAQRSSSDGFREALRAVAAPMIVNKYGTQRSVGKALKEYQTTNCRYATSLFRAIYEDLSAKLFPSSTPACVTVLDDAHAHAYLGVVEQGSKTVSFYVDVIEEIGGRTPIFLEVTNPQDQIFVFNGQKNNPALEGGMA